MAVFAYEKVEPTLIENTKMRKMFIDGVHKVFEITPDGGYVLHDNTLDVYGSYDEAGNGIGEIIPAYTECSTTVEADYDFADNPRGIYSVVEQIKAEERTVG